MSFILDALYKTERDKDIKSKPIPDLNATHSVSSDGSELTLLKQSPRLLIVIASLLVVAVSLLLALLMRDTQETSKSMDVVGLEQRPASVTVDPKTPVLSPKIPVEIERESSINGLPDLAESEKKISIRTEAIDPEIQALYDVPEDVHLPPSRILTATRREQEALPEKKVENIDQALAQALWDASEIKQNTPIPEHLRVSSPEKNVTITPEPKSVTAEASEVDAPFEQTMAAFDTVPFLHELSENTQTRIPTLMYAEHQYVNGYVVFNRKTVQAGEVVEGVKVERILADGVVLSFEGRQFKLAELSSWVNY